MTLREWLKATPPPVGNCPTHGGTYALQRHNNRPADLFVCSAGPHYLLWTPRDPTGGGAGYWKAMPTLNDLPELDKPLGYVPPPPPEPAK